MVEQSQIKIISDFTGKYLPLCNSYLCSIEYGGLRFSSVEAAFQAQKCVREYLRQKFVGISPEDAIKLGESFHRDDWDLVRSTIMTDLLRVKFSTDPLRSFLISTGNSYIQSQDTSEDGYWGVKNNRLGEILMQVRHEISSR